LYFLMYGCNGRKYRGCRRRM